MRNWGVAVIGISGLLMPYRAWAKLPAAPSGQDAVSRETARLNTTGRDIPLGGPLTDNGFVLGEISYVLKADDQLIIDAQMLLPLLQKALAPEMWARISGKIGARQGISAEELAGLGLPIAYDPANFGLKLALRPEDRPRQIVSVSGGYDPLPGIVEQPSRFSGYVTAFANLDYVHEGFDKGLADPNILLDSAIRYDDFVLENTATVQDRFIRQGSRIVYDDLAHTARYSLGDLDPIARGFSGATPLAGLSISRIYADLEPQRNIQPRGQRSFTLTRAATVETFVNGQSVQQTRLNPGTYDIRDFPFAQGSNDVRLQIRDDAGVESSISFSINFDRTLLAPGLSEFGLYAGVQSPFTASGRHYSDTPAAQGFYRRGITAEITAGGNFQLSSKGGVAGAEVIWASPIGTIATNLAASSNRHVGSGYALNIGYERILGTTGYGTRSLTASFQTISRNFATPGTSYAANLYAYEIGATYSQSIGRDQYASLDSFYSAGRNNTPDQLSFRATYGWRATTRLLLTGEALYENRGSGRNYGLRLALTYRFGRSSSASAEVDTRRERTRLTYQTSQGTGVGSINGSASVDRTDQGVALNADVTTIQNRAEISLAHLTSLSSDGGEITDQRTSLRIGTSLAFAGGEIAVGRPIYDSFALVKPHRSLDGAPVYLDPRNQEYLAKSGMLGSAVAPELSSYSPRLLTYDVPASPVGYDIGPGAVQFVPPYRAGYLVEIGSDYSVTYTGTLLKADGAPLALAAGHVVEIAKTDREPVRMFTNRAGRFAVEGLRPGKWRIEIADGDRTIRYIIDVPADAKGLVRGGQIEPEDPQ